MRAADVLRDWVHVSATWPRALLDRTHPEALATGSRSPIVLLPGIWEPWRYLLPIARALHGVGHPIHPVPALRLNGAPLDASADVVAEAITGHGANQVILVAHSKGGLIGKQLMLNEAVGHRIMGMVSLCTPFGGSSLAIRPLARTPLGLFSPTNSALRALAEEVGVNARITSIGSRWDEMVPAGTHLDGARNLTLSSAGHFRPLALPHTHEVVVSEVQRLEEAGEP